MTSGLRHSNNFWTLKTLNVSSIISGNPPLVETRLVGCELVRLAGWLVTGSRGGQGRPARFLTPKWLRSSKTLYLHLTPSLSPLRYCLAAEAMAVLVTTVLGSTCHASSLDTNRRISDIFA